MEQRLLVFRSTEFFFVEFGLYLFETRSYIVVVHFELQNLFRPEWHP